MRPAFITYAAKKTAAVVIAGTLVVATGSFALAAAGEETEPDDTTTTTTTEVEETTTTTEVDETTTTTEPEGEGDEVESEETEEAEEAADEPTEDPADLTVEEVEPVEDVETKGEFRNHGEAVRQAAHECPKGPGHGACVSAVAKSDAGKSPTAPEPAPEETTGDEIDEGDSDAALEVQSAEPAPKAKADNAGGNGKGPKK